MNPITLPLESGELTTLKDQALDLNGRETAAPPNTRPSVRGVLKRGIHDLLYPEKGNIPGLDVLRTLAILLVFSMHFYDSFSVNSGASLSLNRFPLIHFGWTGVDLFFVLSGYLIGRQLWREMDSTGNIQIGRFLLRRGLRIWPFYFAFLVIRILIGSPNPLSSYWPDFTFLSNYFGGQVGGGWSLSTEEQFYIFVPLLLIASRYLLPLRRQWMVIVGLLALLPVFRWIALARYGAHVHGADALFSVTYAPFHTHSDGLLAGLLLAWMATVYPRHLEHRTLLRNLPAPVALAVAGLLVRHLSPDYFAFTGLALVYGGCALFVLRDGSPLAQLWRPRIFHVFSRLSYALYLNHLVVMYLIMPRLWPAGSAAIASEPRFIATYCIVLGLSMAAAATTFVLIESPFLQLRSAWLARRKSAAA